MNFPEAAIATKLWDYLSSIHIGVARVDSEQKQVQFCNAFCTSMFSDMSQENLFPFFEDFLGLTHLDPTGSFRDSRKKVIYGSLLLSVFTIAADETNAWVFLQDVTDIVRLESIAEAVNIMDNIGYIFSGIRHEIGNPINTIKMTMSVLKKNLHGLPLEKIQSYIDRTLEEIVRLEELLQSLKSYNMFDKPLPQNIHIPSFMNKFISLVEQDFCTEGVTVKINTSGELWARVDPRGLQQVMLNIVTNAFDAVRNIPNPVISINLYRFINQVCIKISDNGCGIPEALQAKLFQPFYTTKMKGTGLGLVISRKILKNMESSIRIQSEVNKGSSVLISLPGGMPDE